MLCRITSIDLFIEMMPTKEFTQYIYIRGSEINDLLYIPGKKLKNGVYSIIKTVNWDQRTIPNEC